MHDYMKLLHGYNIYKNFDYKKYEHKIVGWNTDPVLYEEYITTLKPSVIVELGSWLGSSAIAMGHIIKKHNLDTKIICIDTWLGSLEFIGLHDEDPARRLMSIHGQPTIYYHFLANVLHEKLQDVIIPLCNTFHHGCSWLDMHDISADLIYVDGDNGLVSIYNDLNDAWSILQNDGIMFGDDLSNPGWPGIRLGLNKFCIDKNIRYEPINSENFWQITKKHIQ